MRARNIKPGFFKNEELAECQPLARILFSGLWCLADRNGYVEDRPKRIKAEVLPHDNCDCDALLQELEAHSFIKRIMVNDIKVLVIPTFKDHQRPHPKEPEIFPAVPEKKPAQPRKKPAQPEKGTNEPEINRVEPDLGANEPCTFALNPSNLNPSNLNAECLIIPADKPPTPKPRKPDPLFDAIAEVTASDPKASGSHIGRVKKMLLAAEPPYTPEEVRKWFDLIREEGWLDGYPSLGYLEQSIGKVRAAPLPEAKKTTINGQVKSTLADQRAAVRERFLKEGQNAPT